MTSRSRFHAAVFLLLSGLLTACSGTPEAEEPVVLAPTEAPVDAADRTADRELAEADAESATTDALGEPSAELRADGSILVDGDQASFLMPSQNVACLVRPDQVTCQIDSKEYDARDADINPEAFAGCTPAEADAMSVGGGADPTWTCLPYDLRPEADVTTGGAWTGPGLGATTDYDGTAVTVLPYGTTLRLGNISCTSDPAGVRCTDLVTGHGFQVARERYSTF